MAEKLYSLDEIIRMTGHRTENSAYVLLRRAGKKPDGFRPSSRKPRALWRQSVIEEVFSSQLARARRIRRP